MWTVTVRDVFELLYLLTRNKDPLECYRTTGTIDYEEFVKLILDDDVDDNDDVDFENIAKDEEEEEEEEEEEDW